MKFPSELILESLSPMGQKLGCHRVVPTQISTIWPSESCYGQYNMLHVHLERAEPSNGYLSVHGTSSLTVRRWAGVHAEVSGLFLAYLTSIPSQIFTTPLNCALQETPGLSEVSKYSMGIPKATNGMEL